MVKTIKISDENYVWLTKLAGKLQNDWGQPVSIDSAISYVHKSKDVTDLAGSWQLSEKQVHKTTTELKDRWKSWTGRYLVKNPQQLQPAQSQQK